MISGAVEEKKKVGGGVGKDGEKKEGKKMEEIPAARRDQGKVCEIRDCSVALECERGTCASDGSALSPADSRELGSDFR